jgi:ribosomal protein S27E
VNLTVNCECGHEQLLGVTETVWSGLEYKSRCERCGRTLYGFVIEPGAPKEAAPTR